MVGESVGDYKVEYLVFLLVLVVAGTVFNPFQ